MLIYFMKSKKTLNSAKPLSIGFILLSFFFRKWRSLLNDVAAAVECKGSVLSSAERNQNAELNSSVFSVSGNDTWSNEMDEYRGS